MCFVVCFGLCLEANAPASVAEIVVEICLIAILKSNVVEELIVVVGEWIEVIPAIVSIVEAANVSWVLVIYRVAELYFAKCFGVDWREG